jgi:putative DNA primase/helicase
MFDTRTLTEVVWDAYASGISVVPPREDGSKRPAVRSWKRYQTQRPTRREIAAWYAAPCTGVGFLTGAVSGNLELFEFDDVDAYLRFKALATAAAHGDLVARIEAGYCERTPGGGVHWLYRCPVIAGNTRLAARRRDDGTVKVLIETRGDGGYVVVAHSYGAVHPSGRPYELLQGGVATIVTLMPQERATLWSLARSLDEVNAADAVRRAQRPGTGGVPSRRRWSGTRPGDAFNRESTWEDLLPAHGWHLVYVGQDGAGNAVGYWRRPGKAAGISATTNFAGSDQLYVFSTSTLLPAGQGLSKFAAYAYLSHGGDFVAAAVRVAPAPRAARGHAAHPHHLGRSAHPVSGSPGRGGVPVKPLNPMPSVTLGDVLVFATEADRKQGLTAHVRARRGVDGPTLQDRLVRFADPADRDRFVDALVTAADLDRDAVVAALDALQDGIEAELRGPDPRR